jgi:hypothetical protein
LVILTIFACSQGTGVPAHPQEVLGVTLGGSLEELEAVYNKNRLALQKTSKDSYVSGGAVKPLAGLPEVEINHQIVLGVLHAVEVIFEGDVSDELQALLDEKYSEDPVLRQQLEQKQRFIGTIGEKDHYWLLPDMAVMVVVKMGETRLIYSLK